MSAASIPIIGQPLPRASEAYVKPEKWDGWILAGRGHGREWAYVFQVEAADADLVWLALAEAVLDAPIASIREVGEGLNCQVDAVITVKARTASVRSVWHCDSPSDRPHLVTAFPTP